MIKGKSYTFFIASTPGKLRKLIVPAYALHGLAVLALIGMITVVAAAGSYTRMLWKVGNYNALRHEQETLESSVPPAAEHSERHQPAAGFSAIPGDGSGDDLWGVALSPCSVRCFG